MTLHFIRAAAWPGRARPARVALTLLALLLTMALRAHAAGGHHAVDDAAMLDAGQCQLETWADRSVDGARASSHVGPGCRLGAVELSLNVDRVRGPGAGTTAGPQLKWAAPVNEVLSLGAVASTSWQVGSASPPSRGLLLLATWQPAEAWRIHANAGRDFRPGAPSGSHSGVALEWQASPAWSFVAERFREGGGDHERAGARWALSTAVNVDVSRARSGRDGGPAWWTVGLTWAFAR